MTGVVSLMSIHQLNNSLTHRMTAGAVMAHQNKIKKKKNKKMRQIHMITDSLSLPNHQTPNTFSSKERI